MTFRAAVVTFPGSNCDRDMATALEAVSGEPALRVWHGETDLPARLDLIALPGGFSYGDYLRAGAMAAQSPVMRSVIAAARRGVPVLGICNGFQILTESGLLPGALMRNAAQRFVCRTATLEVGETTSIFTHGFVLGERLRIPVAHHDGNYFAEPEVLDRLEYEGRIAFRYAEDAAGSPNGSQRRIAGVLSDNGRVLGMMPHPERAIEPVAHDAFGGTDGRRIFTNVLHALTNA
ncbi:MAG: phosphoribosylformylglycinamidine synthase subunit PurQ [Erythrobacter sp.]